MVLRLSDAYFLTCAKDSLLVLPYGVGYGKAKLAFGLLLGQFCDLVYALAVFRLSYILYILTDTPLTTTSTISILILFLLRSTHATFKS